MRFSDFSRCALSICAAVAFLAGCAGSQPPIGAPGAVPQGAPQRWGNVSLIPQALGLTAPTPLRGIPAPDSATRGIYVSAFFYPMVYGYPEINRHNHPPICTETGVSNAVNGIAVDAKGNLIVPNGAQGAVFIFQGPGMCGPMLGSFTDPYGMPSDASSPDAATGIIAVGNIFDNGNTPGSISICTLSGGCTVNLTNPNLNEVAGVAMDRNGDCWASGSNGSAATLTYFKSCAGAGRSATGFKNDDYGGLDVDSAGNLVSIDEEGGGTGQVWVYSGCKPACKRVGGPFALHGAAVFGHLNKKSTRFVTGDFQFLQVDIYSYSPTAIKYLYSFNKGLSPSADVEGAAYNPRSKE
jgi:hypothetical protein